MTFLLDTNVVSETVKRKPKERVLMWLSAQSAAELFLSSITIGELVRGARQVQQPERRQRYEGWIEGELVKQFEGRILAFDHDAARIWGEMMGDGDRAGRPPAIADAQIAAIAYLYRLTLVTRNTKDFASLDIRLFNPWTDEAESDER